jgi:hypothetical protein
MKLFKTTLLIASFVAGLAVASCFAHGPHNYNHYRQRMNYYPHGITLTPTPYGGYRQYHHGAPFSSPLYYPYNSGPVIIVAPQDRSGWQQGTVYGRPYYRF